MKKITPMRSIVLFSSKSGNTRRLAHAVYDALPEMKEIYLLESRPASLESYDFVAFGFWLQEGQPDAASLEVLPTIQNKNLFLFASHSTSKKSDHAALGMEKAKKLAASCTITGTFSCQGEVNPTVLDMIKKKPEPYPWVKEAVSAVGHPDTKDLVELQKIVNSTFCFEFFRNVLRPNAYLI